MRNPLHHVSCACSASASERRRAACSTERRRSSPSCRAASSAARRSEAMDAASSSRGVSSAAARAIALALAAALRSPPVRRITEKLAGGLKRCRCCGTKRLSSVNLKDVWAGTYAGYHNIYIYIYMYIYISEAVLKRNTSRPHPKRRSRRKGLKSRETNPDLSRGPDLSENRRGSRVP